MSKTLSLRVPDVTADWLKSAARRTGRSVNEIGAQLLEESRRTAEFGEIEFKSFGDERHACLKGRLPLWRMIETARTLGMDSTRTAAHFDWPLWRVEAGLRYYEAFSEEIDAAIEENQSMDFERLQRLFPRVQLVELP